MNHFKMLQQLILTLSRALTHAAAESRSATEALDAPRSCRIIPNWLTVLSCSLTADRSGAITDGDHAC